MDRGAEEVLPQRIQMILKGKEDQLARGEGELGLSHSFHQLGVSLGGDGDQGKVGEGGCLISIQDPARMERFPAGLLDLEERLHAGEGEVERRLATERSRTLKAGTKKRSGIALSSSRRRRAWGAS